MIKLLLIILFIGKMSLGFAQISGSVSDSESNKVIVGAKVVVTDLSGELVNRSITKYNGRYSFAVPVVDSYRFQISYIGFASIDTVITVSINQVIDFSLRSLSGQLKEFKIIKNKSNLEGETGTGSVIGREQIKLAKPIGTQEILEKIPGLTGFSDDGMGNSRLNIGIRGLPPRRSARVMVLEDGIPIQPAIYTYANMYYNPPVERISEIEVVKGSGAIEYGPLTMGGVVNYITSTPRNELGGRVTQGFGENGYATSFFEIGGWGKKSLQPELQFLYKRGNGFRDNNSFQQYNGTVKLRLNQDSSEHNYYLKLNTNYELSNATYSGLTEYSFANNPNFNPKSNDEFMVFRSAIDFIHTRYKKNGNLSQDKVYLNYFNRDWWRENDVFYLADEYGSDNVEPVDFLTNGDIVRAGSGDGNLGIQRSFQVAGYEKILTYKHRFLNLDSTANLKVGVRFHLENFNNDIQRGVSPEARTGTYLYLDPATGDTLFKGTSENYTTLANSIFIKETVTMDKLSFDLGVRIENYFQNFKNNLGSESVESFQTLLLPGVGVNYKLTNSEVFGGVHRGFTPAASSSLVVAAGDGGAATKLKPETSWNTELGYRYRSKILTWESALFYLFISDMINVSRGVSVTNIDLIHSRGIENYLGFDFSKLNPNLPDLSVTYTYLNTSVQSGYLEESALFNGPSIVDGKEMPYAPNHNLVISLKKTIKDKFILTSSFKYLSKSYTDIENIEFTYNRGDTGPIPSYWLLDAGLRFEPNSKWSFDVTAKNIFDLVYIGSRLHSSPGNRGASLSSGILPGARRQINMNITFSF